MLQGPTSSTTAAPWGWAEGHGWKQGSPSANGSGTEKGCHIKRGVVRPWSDWAVAETLLDPSSP
eukprot:4346105-Karenia_brevis.AAC.1